MIMEVNCTKCNGAMTEGFVLDHGDMDYRRQQIWIEGRPEKSFWSGLDTADREKFHVRAFRCAACNFLEFYTTEKI